ncbi:hypothetical protein [uncultured Aquitalea sp.]|uniref:hypothetical protein n=1 Tax=uncultured Aquitalea sp. TaxID=540272 RepID=UPI0025F8E346|nr:hypothetical protein [uncultured Aquitalea sp.]
MALSKTETMVMVAGLAFVGFMLAKKIQQEGGAPREFLDGLTSPIVGLLQSDENQDNARIDNAMKRFALQAGATWDDVQKMFSEDLGSGGVYDGKFPSDGSPVHGPTGIFANAGGADGPAYTVIDDEPYWNVGNGR